MGDSMFTEFLLEGGSPVVVKQEPSGCLATSASQQDMGPSSASVPIPGSHRAERNAYDQFSPSPLANPALWGSSKPGDFLLESQFKTEMQDPLDPLLSFRMDDDDIFQVDKADLIQTPTLAELNANEDTLLGDLNFDDLLLPDESMQPMRSAPTTAELNPATSIFPSSTSSFAPSSFPQPVQAYRHLPQYTQVVASPVVTPLGGFTAPMTICDPAEAVTTPVLPSLARRLYSLEYILFTIRHILFSTGGVLEVLVFPVFTESTTASDTVWWWLISCVKCKLWMEG